MKAINYSDYSEDTVLMYHIGRGGRFNNQGYLSFVDCKKITECNGFDVNTYLYDRDEKGKYCKPYLTDGSGNILMNAEEYDEAMTTGIGTLDFDGEYDTTYTTYLKDVSEEEFELLNEDLKRSYLVMTNGANEEEVSELEELYYYFT